MERQNELKRICTEKNVEIFGALETKTKKLGFREAIDRLGTEWSIIRNTEDDDEDERDSIYLGHRSNQWKATVLNMHKQYIHARMLNSGGYTFDITVAYGEYSATKRKLLWGGIDSIR